MTEEEEGWRGIDPWPAVQWSAESPGDLTDPMTWQRLNLSHSPTLTAKSNTKSCVLCLLPLRVVYSVFTPPQSRVFCVHYTSVRCPVTFSSDSAIRSVISEDMDSLLSGGAIECRAGGVAMTYITTEVEKHNEENNAHAKG
ncbi:hypothetical protein E2C01_049782 [Portunus trituberculatus]|uniref:Uncharacterized protein n=1 Tax=Portunus trituberculatus TaxID=210409 RepID=A0A5B7GEQ6_PORTR|nr:hypothetical protein [Portunus trituberculatus]